MEFKKKKYKYPKSIYVNRKEMGYSSEEQELDMYIDKIYKSKDEEYINRIRKPVELVQDTKFNFTIRLCCNEISKEEYKKQMGNLLEFIKLMDENPHFCNY